MSGIKAFIEGDERFKQFLFAIQHNGMKAILTEMGTYFVGNESRGLKHYPPPKPSKYVRTYTLRGGWEATTPQGNSLYIKNPVPYASYVQGDPPAQHMRRRGWRGYKDVIMSNMDGALRAGRAALQKILGGW